MTLWNVRRFLGRLRLFARECAREGRLLGTDVTPASEAGASRHVVDVCQCGHAMHDDHTGRCWTASCDCRSFVKAREVLVR